MEYKREAGTSGETTAAAPPPDLSVVYARIDLLRVKLEALKLLSTGFGSERGDAFIAEIDAVAATLDPPKAQG